VKRAFTLIELLVVIAIIAILAAILFPVFAQAKAQAKKAASLSNTKQMNLAGQIYLNDADDLYPLEAGQDTTGVWHYGARMTVPWNWPSIVDTRIYASQGFYDNSVQPYMKNFGLLNSPLGATDNDPITGVYTAGGIVAIQKTTYTYNGLMQSYNSTAMQSPATVPVIWAGWGGSFLGNGWGMAQPNLYCPQAGLPCSYQPCTGTNSGTTNGTGGYFYGPPAPYKLLTDWETANGQNWAYADGHSKFRKIGNSTTAYPPGSNGYVEPWVSYNTLGVPNGSYWWDGCFAWLFRPDYVPPNGFN